MKSTMPAGILTSGSGYSLSRTVFSSDFTLPPGNSPALRQVRVKLQIIRELIAGRFDLFEAADQFRTLEPEGAQVNPEGWCRTVIGWVDLALRDRPEKAEALCSQLERELRERLEEFSLPRLPGK